MNNCIKCNTEILQGTIGRPIIYCSECRKKQYSINVQNYNKRKKEQKVNNGSREQI